MTFGLFVKGPASQGWRRVHRAAAFGSRGRGFASAEEATYFAQKYLSVAQYEVHEDDPDQTVTVQITTEHWVQARQQCLAFDSRRETDCLIAVALSEFFGGEARVGHTTVHISRPRDPRFLGTWYGDYTYRMLVRLFDTNRFEPDPNLPMNITLYRHEVYSG